MPKIAKELSAIDVRRMKRPGAHAVGGVQGLLLQISESGARSWILRTRIGGRRREVGLGSFPDVSLANAREIASQTRRQVRDGIDPVAERRAKRDAMRAESAREVTFSECVRQYLKAKNKEFRNPKHRAQWGTTLETYAAPVMGNLPISRIELAHVVKALKPIWETKIETATRVRGRIEKVIDYATVHGYRKGENPARWRGNLDAILAKPSRLKNVKHFRALPWQEVPAFIERLRKEGGIGARALEFLILTAGRSGEIRGATWREFDTKAKQWTIPGERMKGGKEHVVPISDAALKILLEAPRFDGCEHVFPSARNGPLSDMTLGAVLKRMEVNSTVHGFRSAFKDWARNRTSYLDEVSELCLAHVSTDATRAAYARDGLLEQRRALLASWADYCNKPSKVAAVVDVAKAEGMR